MQWVFSFVPHCVQFEHPNWQEVLWCENSALLITEMPRAPILNAIIAMEMTDKAYWQTC